MGFANACSAPLFSACSARRKRNRPAVGYPPYVGGACGDPVVGLRRRNRLAVGCLPYDHQHINRHTSSVASYRR
ncbi:MAG: hypothetical protein LBQ66_08295 [Planctomycetaceae bacterium]|nr:hypothetical protein [Planctomycetaceae bacterium]